MATWYIDQESGSDDNSGDSFNVDLTGADFVTTGTSTTLTKATGGFTGMAGRKIYIVGTGGRTINSVTNDTTVILNATLTAGTRTANIGGRRQTLANMNTTNCQGITGGDSIRMKASLTPTDTGVDACWRNCDPSLILVGRTRTQVTDCESAWTGVTNVTVTQSTTAKVGTYSASVAIATGFTTGKAAFFDLGSDQDYSSKQILTFWYQQVSGTASSATNLQIRLCSDASGVTAVNTLSVPALPVGVGSTQGRQNEWIPVAIDFGSALSSTVRSIAVYVNADQGAQTFLFDDFKVCNAPNLVKTIDLCETAWTASANVTTTTSATRKEGSLATSIAPGASFTTGLAAYKTLTSTDFSGYRQVSFWIQQTVGTVGAASSISLALCSDTAGATPVNTINIPAVGGLSAWHQVTVDTGGALGAAIQSVALYVNTDNGAQTFLIDNIIACKDSTSVDALSIHSFVGKSVSCGAGGDDTDTWCPIRSIVNNTVIIDKGISNSASTASYGHYHTDSIEAVYKLEPIKTTPVAANGTNIQSFTLAGTSGNPITISGGWSRTDMSTQTGFSFFNAQCSFGIGLSCTNNFQNYEKIGCFNGNTALSTSASDQNISYFLGTNGANGFSLSSGARPTLTDCWSCNTSTNSLVAGAGGIFTRVTISNGVNGPSLQHNNTLTDCIICNNSTAGIVTGIANKVYVVNPVLKHNTQAIGTPSFAFSGDFVNITSHGNATLMAGASDRLNIYGGTSVNDGIVIGNGGSGDSIIAHLATSGFTTEVSAQPAMSNGRVIFIRRNNTDDSHYIRADSISWTSQTSVRHTASGIAWQVNPTDTSRRTATNPGIFSLGFYAVPAGTTTIKLWVRRDSTNVVLSLRCRAYRLPGITSDQTASITAAVDTWEEISISISPTSKGVVELEVLAYGGTANNGYFDDLTIGGVSVPLDYAFMGAFCDPLVSATASPYIINATVNNYTEIDSQPW